MTERGTEGDVRACGGMATGPRAAFVCLAIRHAEVSYYLHNDKMRHQKAAIRMQKMSFYHITHGILNGND